MIKGFDDVFMISETKLDESFPGGPFFIEVYHTTFMFDQNGNGSGILLCVLKDIPVKVMHCDFPTSASFYVEISLPKKTCLLHCFYSRQKNNICNHLDVITKTLDTYYGEYENLVFLGYFNAGTEEIHMKSFCEFCNLTSPIKQPTCFENPKKPSCIDLIITNKPESFQSTCVIETRLSEFHRMTVSFLKMHFQKLPSRVISYRDFCNYDNANFINSLNEVLCKNNNTESFLKQQYTLTRHLLQIPIEISSH